MEKRILIVDDDADWREFLRYALDDLGYECIEARSGEEALERLRRERFSIVLLDMNMPGVSGREVLERMPEPRPRVVLLTSAGAHEVSDVLHSAVSYYLPKDAGSDALSLIVHSLEAHALQ